MQAWTLGREDPPWNKKWQRTPVFLPGNSMDRGAQRTTFHRVAKSGAQLKRAFTAEARVGELRFHKLCSVAKKKKKRKKGIHYFKCADRETTHQASWRTTVRVYHKKEDDDLLETKLKVTEYCDLSENSKQLSWRNSTSYRKTQEGSSVSARMKLMSRRTTLPEWSKLKRNQQKFWSWRTQQDEKCIRKFWKQSRWYGRENWQVQR